MKKKNYLVPIFTMSGVLPLCHLLFYGTGANLPLHLFIRHINCNQI
jgi:hypothetical protein